MRARTAVAIAAMLAAPLGLAALPGGGDRLEGHAASARLEVEVSLLLGRLLDAPRGDPAAGRPDPSPTGPGTAPPGSDPAPGPGHAEGSGASTVLVRFLAGERAWWQGLPNRVPQDVDLDGDAAPDVRVTAEGMTEPRLTVQGLAPVATPWAAYVEQGTGRWGLTGAGLPPGQATVAYQGGSLRVAASEAATADWHVAFMVAGQGRRALAWQSAPDGVDAFDAEVGRGARLVVGDAGPGAARFLLTEDERSHDLTLRGASPGATVLLEPGAAGGFRYSSPAGGGGLAYRGDAALIGQRGRVAFASAWLPTNLTLGPEGQGFAVRADHPLDLVLDWQPPAGQGLRVSGQRVRVLEGEPGGDSGVELRGDGAVRVERTEGVVRSASGATGQGTYVDLEAERPLRVGAAAQGAMGLLAAMAIAGAGAGWALRGRKVHGRRRTRGAKPAHDTLPATQAQGTERPPRAGR